MPGPEAGRDLVGKSQQVTVALLPLLDVLLL